MKNSAVNCQWCVSVLVFVILCHFLDSVYSWSYFMKHLACVKCKFNCIVCCPWSMGWCNNVSVLLWYLKVTRMSLILLTSDFNPEKYHLLSQVLMKVYKKSCSPSVLLENYLLVFTKGVCSTDENGTFRVQDHDIHGLLLYSKVKGQNKFLFCRYSQSFM